MNQNTPGKLPLVVLERWREGLISLRKGTELIDEEEENMDKLPTFKHTIDVPELLKEVIVERITKRKAFNERRSDRICSSC